MRRRKPFQQLRGSDAVLLEVQLAELLRLPIGQLDPINVMDILALSEHPERPKGLARPLDQFVDRCSAQIADLPSGRSFQEFVEEIAGIDASQVPLTFREWFLRESERPDRDTDGLTPLLNQWAEVTPTPFELGTRQAKVLHAEAARRRSTTGRSTSVRSGSGTARKSSRPSTGGRTVAVDRELRDAICRILMERLQNASSSGLAETVLVAGAMHRAKALGHPRVSRPDVTSALKELAESGRIRTSAGRWSAKSRF